MITSLLDEAVKDAVELQEAATKLAEKKIIDKLSPAIKKMVESRLFDDELVSSKEKLDVDNLLNSIESDEFVEDGEFDDFVSSSSCEKEKKLDMLIRPSVEIPEDRFSNQDLTSYSLTDFDDKDNLDNVYSSLEKESDEEEENILTSSQLYEAKNNLLKIKNITKNLEKRVFLAKNILEFKNIYKNAKKLNECVTDYASKPILTKDIETNSIIKESFIKLSNIQKLMEKKMRKKNIRENRANRFVDFYESDDDMTEMDELSELDAMLNLSPESDEEREMLSSLNLDDLEINVSVDGDESDDMDSEDADMDFVSPEDEDSEEESEASDEEELDEADRRMMENARRRLMRKKMINEAKARLKRRKSNLNQSEKEQNLREARSILAARRRQRLKEAASKNSTKDMAKHFGDADVFGDVFYDIDEKTLLNVLRDELGRIRNLKKATPLSENRRTRANKANSTAGRRKIVESAKRRLAVKARLAEMKQKRAKTSVSPQNRRKIVESTKRRLALRKARLDEMKQKRAKTSVLSENKKLKMQLNEMNLFSTKLLYVNKLFAEKNVTDKQRRAIVEAMDNAKTLSECKLLFTSLKNSLKSLENKSAKPLAENRVRVLGSSSKSTPSAQAKTNGEEDRWALLAGIKD
jgi:hypothetical protein